MKLGLKIFSVFTAVGMLIVLLQGSIVTNTGSGEGCGATWPLCFGEVVPQNPALATIIEYSHRLWSSLMGLCVLILAFWSTKQLAHIRETKFIALMAVLFIVFQGLMGAGAVIWGNSGFILALHFGISTISFSTVALLAVFSFEKNPLQWQRGAVSKTYFWYLISVTVYSYMVIYTGAYIKHASYDITVQWIHRSAAVVLILMIIALLVWSWKKYRYSILGHLSTSIFLLIVVQAFSGLVIVLNGSSLTTVLIHALTISVIFTIMIYMIIVVTRSRVLET